MPIVGPVVVGVLAAFVVITLVLRKSRRRKETRGVQLDDLVNWFRRRR